MSAEAIPDSILEAALHAAIAQRCERAYVHDLRNGLQSIYASIDVLTRMLAGKAAPTLSQDKVAEMARKAINAYEQSLDQVAKRLIAQNDSPLSVNVEAALQELCAFLRNDATARGIALRTATSQQIFVRVRPSKFRLVLLSVAVRTIDSQSGGEVTITATESNQSVAIEFGARTDDEVGDDALWRLDGRPVSQQDDWVLHATQKLAAQDAGTIESRTANAGAENSPGTTRVVQIRYPATSPSSRE